MTGDHTITEDLPLLVPMNLHNSDEYQTLQKQRTLCGWNYSDLILSKWRTAIDKKQKSFFWINSPQTGHVRIGHVSLDSTCDPFDLEIANPDKSLLTISAFFILEEFRGKRLASKVMDLLEEYATTEPWGSRSCSAIALHTMDKRYYYNEGKEWRDVWATIGDATPPVPEKGHTNEEWYERRGYVKWKTEPRYPRETLDGSMIKFNAVFLRKTLQ